MVLSLFRFVFLFVLQFGLYNYSNLVNFTPKNLSKNPIEKLSITEDNPVMSPQNVIFEVKHSKGPNVVVYQANKTIKNLLNTEKPIDVFWLMNTKGKKVESLTSIEWRMAFGYKLKTIISGKKYTLTLNAIENKVITISQNEAGQVEAFMIINGVNSKLSSVFIDFEYSFCLPNVKYVQFIGRAVNSNKVMLEKVAA